MKRMLLGVSLVTLVSFAASDPALGRVTRAKNKEVINSIIEAVERPTVPTKPTPGGNDEGDDEGDDGTSPLPEAISEVLDEVSGNPNKGNNSTALQLLQGANKALNKAGSLPENIALIREELDDTSSSNSDVLSASAAVRGALSQSLTKDMLSYLKGLNIKSGTKDVQEFYDFIDSAIDSAGDEVSLGEGLKGQKAKIQALQKQMSKMNASIPEGQVGTLKQLADYFGTLSANASPEAGQFAALSSLLGTIGNTVVEKGRFLNSLLKANSGDSSKVLVEEVKTLLDNSGSGGDLTTSAFSLQTQAGFDDPGDPSVKGRLKRAQDKLARSSAGSAPLSSLEGAFNKAQGALGGLVADTFEVQAQKLSMGLSNDISLSITGAKTALDTALNIVGGGTTIEQVKSAMRRLAPGKVSLEDSIAALETAFGIAGAANVSGVLASIGAAPPLTDFKNKLDPGSPDPATAITRIADGVNTVPLLADDSAYGRMKALHNTIIDGGTSPFVSHAADFAALRGKLDGGTSTAAPADRFVAAMNDVINSIDAALPPHAPPHILAALQRDSSAKGITGFAGGSLTVPQYAVPALPMGVGWLNVPHGVAGIIGGLNMTSPAAAYTPDVIAARELLVDDMKGDQVGQTRDVINQLRALHTVSRAAKRDQLLSTLATMQTAGGGTLGGGINPNCFGYDGSDGTARANAALLALRGADLDLAADAADETLASITKKLIGIQSIYVPLYHQP